MTESFPFIGRQAEIEKVEKSLFDWGTSQCLFVYSVDGGIGKTRLLQEIYAKYSQPDYMERRLLIVPIIDFDDRAVNSRGTLQRKMVSELGDEKFTSYLRRLFDWRKLESAGVSLQRLEEESQQVRREFQHCLTQIALTQRIVFLLDTTEKVEGNEIWGFLMRFLAESQNIVVVISGRNAKNIYQEHFQASKNKIRQTLLPLRPFSSNESDHYLQIKLQHIKQVFQKETVEKIKLLSKGIPILFDLALERLAQDDRFAEFLYSRPSLYFKNLSLENRSESEKIMVSYLADQRTELSELILLLAHVYPVNKNMLLGLLRLDSLSEVDQLLEKALATVYVKQLPGQRISLHDEMRRMVNEHVWPICDPDNYQRKQYSHKAVIFFGKDIQFLSDQIEKEKKNPSSLEVSIALDNLTRRRDNTQVEYLRHLLVKDIEQGVDYYLKTVDEARRVHRLRFAQRLGACIKDFEPLLDGDKKYRLEIARVKQMIDSGPQTVPEVKQILSHLLKLYSDSEKKRLEILNLLGRCEELSGNYEQALAYEEETLEKLSRTEDKVRVLNYIGYIHRLKGDWRHARQYYDRALEEAQRSSEISQNTIANIYNNLAYVVCLVSNYVEATEYCLEAIRIWENIGVSSPLGRGFLTRAIIYRDRGKYEDADIYFKKAIGIFKNFEEPDDYKNLTSAYFDYAWSLRFQGDVLMYEENDSKGAQQLYQTSKDYFDQAKELAENYEVISFLPGIVNQMSYIYWQLGLKKDARQLLTESYELSKKYNDVRYQVDSLLGLAEFDSEEEKYNQIASYAQELKENYEEQGYEFPLSYGRMKRIQADVALIKKDWKLSKELYAAAIAQVSLHGGYGLYFLYRELAHAKEFMQRHLPSETIIEWLSFFKTYWRDHASKKEEKRGKLLGWCSTFINQVKSTQIENE